MTWASVMRACILILGIPLLLYTVFSTAVQASERDRSDDRPMGDTETQIKIERKLEECEMHFDANRLTTGPSGNALVCYKDVLSMDKENVLALRGIAEIGDRYLTWTKGAIARGDASESKTYLSKLKYINPDHPDIGILERQVLDLSAVVVPRVENVDEELAGEIITQHGLSVGKVRREYHRDVEVGRVINQKPDAETKVVVGSPVDLTISTGPPLVTVPELKELPQSIAIETIKRSGLIIGSIKTENSDSIAFGRVIKQDPPLAIKVVLGSQVNLVISLGPSRVVVPDVVGEGQDFAEKAIAGAGLVVGTVETVPSDKAELGRVVTQQPTAGIQVLEGSRVKIAVSSGPAFATMCRTLTRKDGESYHKLVFKADENEKITIRMELDGANVGGEMEAYLVLREGFDDHTFLEKRKGVLPMEFDWSPSRGGEYKIYITGCGIVPEKGLVGEYCIKMLSSGSAQDTLSIGKKSFLGIGEAYFWVYLGNTPCS